ncbi:MAG: MATE family efflux transporter [Candidatus Aphodosoma sp.]
MLPTTLGTEPIGKLLKQFAIPAIIAMTASSLYNMIDSIFIGQGVGTLAISGLAVTFPFMNLAAAFGSLVGVGASTMISVKLGQKDYDTARKVLGNVLSLNIIIGVIFTVVSLLFLDQILYFFGASENTIPYAREYMVIILWGNIITHCYLGLNSAMRSSGMPNQAMGATILTVVLNAILDPLFIFVFKWGIQGAAIATILAQVVSLIWLFISFSHKDKVMHFTRKGFLLEKRIVASSLSIGMSPFLMNVAACLIVIVINRTLYTHGGDLAIAAYGIINRVVFVIVMIVLGLNQGMQPIAGYNFGAQNKERVFSVLKLTIVYAIVITTTGFLICEIFPYYIARVFTSDENLIAETEVGMRYVVMIFPIVGFQMVSTNFFQSIGMARQAIFLSLTRQLLFLLPGLLIFPYYFGTTGVWISMPISDFLAAVVALAMMIYYMRKFRNDELLINI